MKRKTLTEEEIINAWLEKYHGITIQELVGKHPRLVKTPKWYDKYPVTQEQHDQWSEWLTKKLMWYWGCSRKVAQRDRWAIYLNCAPNVK